MTNNLKSYASLREHSILEVLRTHGGACRTGELAALLNVSEETVRRNVKRLVKEGLVVKVHGGVLLANVNEEPAFAHRLEENRSAKQHMAACVADMIGDGASLFLDNSSTTTFVAEALRARKNLFVVTNSISAAARLSAHNNNRVFFAGGEIRQNDGGSYGPEAMDFVRGFQTDYAILAASALNAEHGFMLTDLSEAAFVRLFIQNAHTSIFVVDQSKIGRTGPVVIDDPSRIGALVTDAPLPPSLEKAAESWHMETYIATGESGCEKGGVNV